MKPMYCVRIEGPNPGTVSFLSHKDRTSWSRRRAQQHAKDIREGRTGIREFVRVTVVEA